MSRGNRCIPDGMIKNMPANAGDIREVQTLRWEDPLEEGIMPFSRYHTEGPQSTRLITGYCGRLAEVVVVRSLHSEGLLFITSHTSLFREK